MSVEILRFRQHDGLRLVLREAFTVPSTFFLLSFIMINHHAAMIDQVASDSINSHTLIAMIVFIFITLSTPSLYST